MMFVEVSARGAALWHLGQGASKRGARGASMSSVRQSSVRWAPRMWRPCNASAKPSRSLGGSAAARGA